jgi:hypothetical protein
VSKLSVATLTLVLLGGALAPAQVSAQTEEPVGPDTVVFTRRGTITFLHAKHAEQTECATCHHESRPERPLESPRQKCSDCHASPVEPMKTSLRNAMHDTEAKEGVCFTCHKEQVAKGVAAPMRCSECHKEAGGGSRP